LPPEQEAASSNLAGRTNPISKLSIRATVKTAFVIVLGIISHPKPAQFAISETLDSVSF
jgi:hypothetical protein